jgi:hypothetical protein
MVVRGMFEARADGPTDKMLGDQLATFRLDNGNGNHNNFEVDRLEGRWYIIDSGV